MLMPPRRCARVAADVDEHHHHQPMLPMQAMHIIANLCSDSVDVNSSLTKHAVLESMTVREAVIDLGFVERGEVTLEQLDSALDVLRMTAPGL